MKKKIVRVEQHSTLVEEVCLQFHDADLALPGRRLRRGVEPGSDFLALFNGGSIAAALPILLRVR